MERYTLFQVEDSFFQFNLLANIINATRDSVFV